MIRLGLFSLFLSIIATVMLVPASVRATATAPATCMEGYVWRQADATDHVCVTPAQRDQAASENAATGLKNADGTCVQGYVWRQANPTDHVCVTPAQRSQFAAENAAEASHTVSVAAANTVSAGTRLPAQLTSDQLRRMAAATVRVTLRKVRLRNISAAGLDALHANLFSRQFKVEQAGHGEALMAAAKKVAGPCTPGITAIDKSAPSAVTLTPTPPNNEITISGCGFGTSQSTVRIYGPGFPQSTLTVNFGTTAASWRQWIRQSPESLTSQARSRSWLRRTGRLSCRPAGSVFMRPATPTILTCCRPFPEMR